jgi:hypothetical protein
MRHEGDVPVRGIVCAQRGALIIAAQWPEHIDERRVRNFWSCDECAASPRPKCILRPPVRRCVSTSCWTKWRLMTDAICFASMRKLPGEIYGAMAAVVLRCLTLPRPRTIMTATASHGTRCRCIMRAIVSAYDRPEASASAAFAVASRESGAVPCCARRAFRPQHDIRPATWRMSRAKELKV